MCSHGDTIDMEVLVPAHLAWEGVDTMKVKPIDRCIAPMVKALNDGRVTTISSCCGHGKGVGQIMLLDGTLLLLTGGWLEDGSIRMREAK